MIGVTKIDKILLVYTVAYSNTYTQKCIRYKGVLDTEDAIFLMTQTSFIPHMGGQKAFFYFTKYARLYTGRLNMIDQELMEKLRLIKEKNNYTLDELSRRLDVQISTLERWLKTGRINKVYANMVKEKLKIDQRGSI